MLYSIYIYSYIFQRLEKAIKDIKDHHEKQQINGRHHSHLNVPKPADTGSVISIDPIVIPKMSPHHLLTIDHGLNRENMLSDDEGTELSSLKVSRNALALMPTDSDTTLNHKSPSAVLSIVQYHWKRKSVIK